MYNQGLEFFLGLPIFPHVTAILTGIAILLIWSSCICIRPCKRLRKGKQCYGPCDIATFLSTRCPCIVILFGIAMPLYIGYLGISASNYTVVVDTNFASYLESTSYLKSIEDSYQSLVNEKSKTIKEEDAGNERRRLVPAEEEDAARSTWTLSVFYQVRPSSYKANRGIFYKEALDEIKYVENAIKRHKNYGKYCFREKVPGKKDQFASNCALPTTPVNIFYSEHGHEVRYDGKGQLRALSASIQVLKQMEVPFFVDAKTFVGNNPYSNYTRSRFVGFEDVSGYEDFLKSLHDDLLSNINERLQDVTVSWSEGGVLTAYEVNSALLHDSRWSIGSLTFVAMFVLFHLKSPFLCFFCMLSILLAFPAAYGVFYIVFEVKTMMILNFVSLFLIMGIGADDAFICFDTYHQARALMGPNASIAKRMSWALREASSAMFITTFTTAGSFFSNCISTVKVVREFGLFMGSVVVFNYINMLTIFPAAIVLQELFVAKITCAKPKPKKKYLLAHSFSAAAEKMKRGKLSGLQRFKSAAKTVINMQQLGILALKSNHKINVDELGLVERCCYKCYSPLLRKARFAVPILLTAASVFMGLLGAVNFQLHNGPPKVFQTTENLGRVDVLARTSFHGQSLGDSGETTKVYWGGALGVKGGSCPVTTNTSVTQGIACSGKGTCNLYDFSCECELGFADYYCSKPSVPGTPFARPPSLFVATDSTAIVQGKFEYGNTGDESLYFEWGSLGPLPNWIISDISVLKSGTIEKCTYNKQFKHVCLPSEKVLFVSLRASNKAVGWSDTHTIQFKTKRSKSDARWVNVTNVNITLKKTAPPPQPTIPTPYTPTGLYGGTGDGRITVHFSNAQTHRDNIRRGQTYVCQTQRLNEITQYQHASDDYPIVITNHIYINHTFHVKCRGIMKGVLGGWSSTISVKVLLSKNNADCTLSSLVSSPWPRSNSLNSTFETVNASSFRIFLSAWFPSIAMNITASVSGASLVVDGKTYTGSGVFKDVIHGLQETDLLRGSNYISGLHTETAEVTVVAPAGLNRSTYFVLVHRLDGVCPMEEFGCVNPWTCDPYLWGTCSCFSESCKKQLCNGDCSNNGECDPFEGKCACYQSYKGKYCQTFIPYIVPLKQSIKITLLWGAAKLQTENSFKMNSKFDIAQSTSIPYIIEVIEQIKADPALSIRNKSKQTWIEQFYNGSMTASDIENSLSRVSRLESYLYYVSLANPDGITWIAVDVYLNVSRHTPAFFMYASHYLPWKGFVSRINKNNPEPLGKAIMISSAWTEMDVTIGIIISTVESFVTSNAICFFSVLVFTGDVALSVLTMLSILLIVICLLGTLLGPIFNYTFGAIEAVGVTVFVGMSVDYALHIAHGYHSAHTKRRFDKVRDTLTHLGVSILGGAITTGGSAIFLLFCKIYFFLQLGTMMLLNTLLALCFSIGWLCAILMIIGPETSLFYIYFYLKLPCLIYTWLKERLCRGKSAVIPIADTVEDESLNDVGETSEEDSGREEEDEEDEEDSHTGFSSDESDKPPKVIRKITKPIVLENLKLTQREDSGYASGDFI